MKIKKLFYSLAVFFAFTLSANAQKVINGDIRTVPSFFTFNHSPYFLVADGYDDKKYEVHINSIDILDMSINKIESVNINDVVAELSVRCIDQNGIGHDVKFAYHPHLTQTLFNDDADWEYMVPVKGEIIDKWGYTHEETVSYTIIKNNGSVVGSIPVEKWNGDVYIINDVVYAVTAEESDKGVEAHYFYTLPEFRKLISNGSNGVKAVPAFVRTVKTTHDIVGRQVSENHKGIIIKEGKKMITQ